MEVICKLAVVFGILTLVLVCFRALGGAANPGESEKQCETPGLMPPVPTHELAVSIVQTLVDNDLIERSKANDAVQMVALKIELGRALAETV